MMTAVDWVLASGAFMAIVALVMTCINLRLYQPAPAAGAGVVGGSGSRDSGPVVSVCIPARNEAANIRACVQSLLGGTLEHIEVLVYNDQSTDGTGAILAEMASLDGRVVLPPTRALPAGWNGKQFGCDTLGRSARGDWLLFTDADVRFHPDALARTLAQAQAMRLDLLSTFPRQITGTLGERLAVPMIFFILFSYLPFPRMRRTNDPAASAGCGQFLFARREAYLASGGHAAFKDSMHDGVKMPRTFRRAGFKTDLFDGTDLCCVRMYTGLAQTWRGFTKNAFEGLGSIGLLGFITLVHLLAHVLPWVVVLLWVFIPAFVTAAPHDEPSMAGFAATGLVFAALAVLANILQRTLLMVRFRQPIVGVLLHPIGVLLMTAIQWRSWWLHITGRRVWRGRVAGEPTSAS